FAHAREYAENYCLAPTLPQAKICEDQLLKSVHIPQNQSTLCISKNCCDSDSDFTKTFAARRSSLKIIIPLSSFGIANKLGVIPSFVVHRLKCTASPVNSPS